VKQIPFRVDGKLFDFSRRITREIERRNVSRLFYRFRFGVLFQETLFYFSFISVLFQLCGHY